MNFQYVLVIKMVGAVRIELTTPSASRKCSPTELSAHFDGAEDRNRTGTGFDSRRILSPVRLPVPPPRHLINILEAAPRFELGIKVLQTSALPLGYAA